MKFRRLAEAKRGRNGFDICCKPGDSKYIDTIAKMTSTVVSVILGIVDSGSIRANHELSNWQMKGYRRFSYVQDSPTLLALPLSQNKQLISGCRFCHSSQRCGFAFEFLFHMSIYSIWSLYSTLSLVALVFTQIARTDLTTCLSPMLMSSLMLKFQLVACCT